MGSACASSPRRWESARPRSISISKAALEPSLARSPSRPWPASPGRSSRRRSPPLKQGLQNGVRRQLENDELGDDRSSVQRLHYLEEQFRKVSGGLLLRLERPADAGQGLLGDRARDGPNAAFEMEMDRGRADPQRLGELAQAEPICADALDQLGGGGDDRTLRQAGAGSGLPFLLNIRTRGLLLGYLDHGHDDARDEQGKGCPGAN